MSFLCWFWLKVDGFHWLGWALSSIYQGHRFFSERPLTTQHPGGPWIPGRSLSLPICKFSITVSVCELEHGCSAWMDRGPNQPNQPTSQPTNQPTDRPTYRPSGLLGSALNPFAFHLRSLRLPKSESGGLRAVGGRRGGGDLLRFSADPKK